MSVLTGWVSAPLTPNPPRVGRDRSRERAPRRAGRRPVGLVVAPPARQRVSSCAPDYRRRRLTALLVVAFVTAALLAMGLVALGAVAADDGVPERTAVVEVRTGESLWELAERVAPESPPESVVERIRQLNGMHGSTVHPGQPLVVPDGR